MFNRINVTNSKTEYIPYEKTIIEKRAPTDESVRLLLELQKEAKLNTLHNQNIYNEFKCEFSIIEDVYSYKKELVYKFFINGVEYKDIVILDENDIDKGKERLLHIIVEKISIKMFKSLSEMFCEEK